ncbi:MAG: hypothetical protein JO233_02970 [Candidatus Eremiobacteraeota bacterium]|nr:hypothetical protein [Candidatus Eremiobacteraeota bacterium]
MGPVPELAEGAAPGGPPGGAAPAGAAAPTGADQAANALSSIVRFVPTEIVAIYAAIMGIFIARTSGDPASLFRTVHNVFYVFLFATAIVFWLSYLAQAKQNNAAVSYGGIFWWRLCAAVIAFGVWGIALIPDVTNVMFCSSATNCTIQRPGDFAWVALIGISPLLVLIDNIVTK